LTAPGVSFESESKRPTAHGAARRALVGVRRSEYIVRSHRRGAEAARAVAGGEGQRVDRRRPRRTVEDAVVVGVEVLADGSVEVEDEQVRDRVAVFEVERVADEVRRARA
jgi:hypothetical protein